MMTHFAFWTRCAQKVKPLATLTLILLLSSVFHEGRAATSNPELGPSSEMHDPNPEHIWNRLYSALFIRTDQSGTSYGADAIDPLLWIDTDYLLSGTSHQRALSILDEFLRTHAENRITDPTKKALLQRTLWAVFDWCAFRNDNHAGERRELQARLAEVLRRLALTSKEIGSLGRNYEAAVASGALPMQYDPNHRNRAFLPADLLQPHSAWVCIRSDFGPVAPIHVAAASGRSSFFVFIRLPQGRKATLEYLQALWNAPDPWIASEIDRGDNPNLPQFPVGTEVALLRQMNVFDANGTLVSTPITESLQIRVYRAISARHDQHRADIDRPAARAEQDFYEIRLSQTQLFAGRAGGLRAIERADVEFPTFQTQEMDALDNKDSLQRDLRYPILDRCVFCHSAPGIHSLQSLPRLLKPNRAQVDPASGHNPDEETYGPVWWGYQDALGWKQSQYDWGLLNGYWRANRGSH